MIDYTACTMRDVIERSALLHPNMLRDALYRAASMHGNYAYGNYAHMTHDWATVKSAASMARAARYVAYALSLNGAIPEHLSLSQEIITFREACVLLGIPLSCHGDITERSHPIGA